MLRRASGHVVVGQPYEPPYLPFKTLAGIKFSPSIRAEKHAGCEHCPVAAECARLVLQHDGLALCEPILDTELYPDEPAARDWLPDSWQPEA